MCGRVKLHKYYKFYFCKLLLEFFKIQALTQNCTFVLKCMFDTCQYSMKNNNKTNQVFIQYEEFHKALTYYQE